GGDINLSYATGTVTGKTNVGGLLGSYAGNEFMAMKHNYSTGAVSGENNVGGLIGDNLEGNVVASYWNVETSGLGVSSGGEGKTTEEMMQQETFVGWDFAGKWDILPGSAYPYHSW